MIRFEIDGSELKNVVRELGATEKQVELSINRALNKTATTIKSRAASALSKGLKLRGQEDIRKRLRDIRLRQSGALPEAIMLVVGLNDAPASWFKVKPKQTATGVVFRGEEFNGAFLATMRSGHFGIFKRKSKKRLAIIEQTSSIYLDAEEILKDQVYPDVAETFLKHFISDLTGRVKGFGRQS